MMMLMLPYLVILFCKAECDTGGVGGDADRNSKQIPLEWPLQRSIIKRRYWEGVQISVSLESYQVHEIVAL